MKTSSLQTGHSRRTVIAGAAALACILAAPRIARAAVRAVRIGHNNPDDALTGRGAIAFAKAVAANPVLAPVLKIDVYGNAQLGDDLTMLNGCVKGTIDGMLIGSSVLSNVVPDVGVLNAPYVFASAAPARAMLDGDLGTQFSALSAAKGVPVLAWGENGVRHITSNVPVRSAADLRGLKIRVPQAEIMLNGFLALGAAAAPLSFSLVREALRSGQFQAQENGIATTEASKLFEVQKYLCLTAHIYDAVGFVVSQDLMEDLSAPQRDALAECARSAALVTRQAADAAARDGTGRLRAAGMTIIDDVDIPGLQAAARPYIESLKAKFDPKLIGTMLGAAG